MKTQVLKLIALLMLLTGFSCQKEESNCKDELYFYTSQKLFIGSLLLNDYLLVGFTQQAQDTEIVDYINQTNLFKTVDASDFFYYTTLVKREDDRLIFVHTKKQKTCSQLKEIILMLENAPIVTFASFTFKGDSFTQNASLVPEGYRRIMGFLPYIEVYVEDTNDLSYLHTLIQKTNTEIVWYDDKNWFRLRTDKNSKGNAMQMGNYFYETGKFVYAYPNYVVGELKIN